MSLLQVLTNTTNNSPIVLYLRDVDKLLGWSQRINILFQEMLKKLSGPILILGSRVADFNKDYNISSVLLKSLMKALMYVCHINSICL